MRGCNLAGLHSLNEDAHLFPLGRKILSLDSGVTESLNHLELPNQKLVERIYMRPVMLMPRASWNPPLGLLQMVPPVGDGSLKSKLSEVPNASRLSVGLVTPGVSDTLSPAIDDNSKGADEGTSHDTNGSRDYPNALYIFLFLWGHEWWVLALWWGLLAFVVIVHIDFIYGVIYEIRYFRANVRGQATPTPQGGGAGPVDWIESSKSVCDKAAVRGRPAPPCCASLLYRFTRGINRNEIGVKMRQSPIRTAM